VKSIPAARCCSARRGDEEAKISINLSLQRFLSRLSVP
jgi:hypothetical protein